MDWKRSLYSVLPAFLVMAVAGCGQQPDEPAAPAPEPPDQQAIAEATAAAVKIILEESSEGPPLRQVRDSCGEPHRGNMAPGFGGPNNRPFPPTWAEFIQIGADRPMTETDPERRSDGYIVFTPGATHDTFLIDADNQVVATHTSRNSNGHSRLLDNGNLLRTDASDIGQYGWPEGGGVRGCVMEASWDGEITWEAGLVTEEYVQHHDVVIMPNGNFLTNVWIRVGAEELIQAGRDPALVPENGEFWYDAVFEVDPRTMQVVWEWNSADHLVQDFDPDKDNFGVVADHPERLNINQVPVGPDGKARSDWLHVNSLEYNAELDQVMLSSNYLSEVWIIDHSTTTQEAAGSTGGRYGKGGDFLYRWGNPQNYDRGTETDRQAFAQHYPHWIPDDRPGGGNMLVYNNGDQQTRQWTTVLELELPMNEDGSFTPPAEGPWGPDAPAWTYDPEPPERFFSFYISGAERMPNGNTLVNQGAGGRFREVTPEGEIVREYWDENGEDYPSSIFRAHWYPADHPGIVAMGLESTPDQGP